MDHNNVSLTVSHAEAAKAEDEAKRHLLASRKLSLIVDLDLTIIHATWDSTVSDWQNDENHPNHEAVKDVRSFVLRDDGPERRSTRYYIKLRPGVHEFLKSVSTIYELHIYTMATRAYAKNIADVIDPDHKLFGDRILSRDESGSMHAKTLQRLFPVDTKMVVIIDDRGDVWKWSPNLIKVTPYVFFVGIGDINSSFLPAKSKPGPKLTSNATPSSVVKPDQSPVEDDDTKDSEARMNGDTTHSPEVSASDEKMLSPTSNMSPLEQLVAMGGGDDAGTRKAQTISHDEALVTQLEEKPLLQKQKQLEAEVAATEAAEAKDEKDADESSPSKDASITSFQHEKPKHNLLEDHDRELHHLENSLRKVHVEFFNLYRNELASAQGGRLSQLRGVHKRKSVPDPKENLDLDLVPDIKILLPSIKARVLAGVVIVFSGVFKIGDDTEREEKAYLAKSFGAQVEENVTKYTTHVVGVRNRPTIKVKKALRRGKGKIKIVNFQWFTDSIISFERQDERPYVLDFEQGRNGPLDDDDILNESESPASESGDETDVSISRNKSKPTLHLNTQNNADDTDSESSFGVSGPPSDLDFEEGSPIGGTNEDWSAINEELAQFLGSEEEPEEVSDDDSSAASEASVNPKLSVRGTKRRREENDSDGESENGRVGKVKKKQVMGTGLTSLSQEVSAENDDASKINGDANEANGDDEGDGEGSGEEGDGWSDFEGDLEAELEKAQSEDQAHGEG